MKLQKEVIAMLIICIGLLASLSFVGSASNGIPDYVEGEIIVKYTEEVVNADGNEIIVEGEKSYEKIIYDGISRAVEIEKIVPNKELYTLRFEKGLEVEDLIEEYENLEEVEYAEPNYLLTSFVVPNDINYSLKWGLPNIDAERAWNLSIGNGSDVVIAIVDTGVDWDHPDLSGNIWIIVCGGYLNHILIIFFTASTIALWNKKVLSGSNDSYTEVLYDDDGVTEIRKQSLIRTAPEEQTRDPIP